MRFTSDTALVSQKKSEELLINLFNRGSNRVSDGMKTLNLKLTSEKSEVILLTKRKKLMPITFDLQGTKIILSKAVKYLGVWLDKKMIFVEHINKIIIETEKANTALANLMPHI